MKINIGKLAIASVVALCLGALVGAASAARDSHTLSLNDSDESIGSLPNTERAGGSKVYFTSDISARGLLAVYNALETPVSGRVAIKLHMGEPGNRNFLNPDLLRDLTQAVNGTFVDSSTAYGGRRDNVNSYRQIAAQHGFTYAPIDILDAGGEVRLTVRNGKQVTEARMGANIMRYDWIISVAHFTGHGVSGFGGTFKNLAVGIATPAGKRLLHTNQRGAVFAASGDYFFDKVIDYNSALKDAKQGRILYINVLNNLSADCDCMANAARPTMPNIGIVASLDPVALEKASLDMIYAHPESERRDIVARIETMNGIRQVTFAEERGLGSQFYELVRLQ